MSQQRAEKEACPNRLCFYLWVFLFLFFVANSIFKMKVAMQIFCIWQFEIWLIFSPAKARKEGNPSTNIKGTFAPEGTNKKFPASLEQEVEEKRLFFWHEFWWKRRWVGGMPISAAFSALELAQRNMDGGLGRGKEKSLFSFFFLRRDCLVLKRQVLLLGNQFHFSVLEFFYWKTLKVTVCFMGLLAKSCRISLNRVCSCSFRLCT